MDYWLTSSVSAAHLSWKRRSGDKATISLLYVHLVFALNPTHLWKYPGLTMVHRGFRRSLCSFVFMDRAETVFWRGFTDPLNHYRKNINFQSIMFFLPCTHYKLVQYTHQKILTLIWRFWRSQVPKYIWFLVTKVRSHHNFTRVGASEVQAIKSFFNSSWTKIDNGSQEHLTFSQGFRPLQLLSHTHSIHHSFYSHPNQTSCPNIQAPWRVCSIPVVGAFLVLPQY